MKEFTIKANSYLGPAKSAAAKTATGKLASVKSVLEVSAKKAAKIKASGDVQN